jgi:hypothetical protein
MGMLMIMMDDMMIVEVTVVENVKEEMMMMPLSNIYKIEKNYNLIMNNSM